ncbi:MAG: Rid family detoxifying hydrolase [Nitrososphaerales archaeon]|nr:Rid family detoxifying hydrolase [Nitrososphaerales archaeon]
MKREVRSGGAPTPIGPYSQAVEESGTVFCSGQLGADPNTGRLEEGIVAQTRRAITNLSEVLKAAGLELGDVVRTSVFMVDLAEFPQMNEEYSRHFKPPFPARTTAQAAALPREALVEIDAIARRR